MLNPIITPPRVPLVDPNTGLISRAWYLFLLSLNNVANDVVDNPALGPNPESLIAGYDALLQTLTQEVQTQPTQGSALDQIAELQKQIEGLESAPVLQLDAERNTFETISKNLKAANASFTYDMAGNLTSITYANGIVKTLNYDMAGNLTSIVLSGNIPPEILTVKTLTYDMAGNLTATSYS